MRPIADGGKQHGHHGEQDGQHYVTVRLLIEDAEDGQSAPWAE